MQLDNRKAEYLYIHIPFCLRKCFYCDFYSIPVDGADVAGYVEALKMELLLRRHEMGTLRTVYLGGGTPTAIGTRNILPLLDFIAGNYSLSREIEITVEANPLTITGPMLKAMKGGGVNRLSLGIQSLVDAELATLGRLHGADDGRMALKMASECFDNYSLDLIYAIAGQTPESLKTTVRESLSFAPSHVSAYELTPEKGTPLGDAILGGSVEIPEEDTIVSMFEETSGFLEAHGYNHYEISNYALRGCECKHNVNYWKRGQYVGIGAAAHSFVNETRYANCAGVMEYRLALSTGKEVRQQKTSVGMTEKIEETVFLALRTAGGLSAATLDTFGITDLASLAGGLEELGLVRNCGGNLSLTKRGMLLSNRVIVEITTKLLASLG